MACGFDSRKRYPQCGEGFVAEWLALINGNSGYGAHQRHFDRFMLQGLFALCDC